MRLIATITLVLVASNGPLGVAQSVRAQSRRRRGLVVELARQLAVLDEAGDVDRLAAVQRELLEILVGQLDEAALLVLVALCDIAPSDLVIALRAPPCS